MSDAASSAHPERQGVLLCAIAATGFAGTVVMGRLAHDAGAPLATLLTVRFALAAAVLWMLAARRGVARVAVRRDALVALALGGVYAAQTGLTFASLARIDVSLTELLTFAYPALVVLGAVALRHEAPSRRRLVALALSMSGVALVLAGAGAGALDPLGTAAALGAATLYASYVLAVGRVGGRLPAPTFVALVASGAALAFALGGAATGTLHAMSAAGWGWAVALVLGSTVLAMSAFIGGVARLGAGRASILATLEPPIACVLAFLVFGDRLTPLQLAGGALVLSAALVLQLRPLRSRSRGAAALSADPAPAGALAPAAARRRRLGVRAEVGRLSRDRVRRRRERADPVARR